ncbi:MAG: hypothetical protein GX091_08760 [Peptococcaceae bacterium]|nr:hypothetical protein [Peptococcaceae bacterium]
MGKYDHLITYDPRPDKPGRVADPSIMRKILYMDGATVAGAPYFEIMWFISPREPAPPTHTHDFDEFLGFIGTDPDNPSDLGATVRFLLEDEWIVLTKSALIYVPAGMKHSPFVIEDLRRPIIHFSGGPNVEYNSTSV